MTPSKTPFAGYERLDPGDPLSSDGYSFQFENPEIADRLGELGAVTHKHDAHPAMADPTTAPTVALATTGGTIPSATPIYVTYTLTDAQNGETLPVAAVVQSTAAGYADPDAAPTLAVSYSAGSLLSNTYLYAVTVSDGVGGETAIGPAVTATVDPGHVHAEINLSGLTLITNDSSASSSAAGWRLWRSVDGGSTWVLMGTGSHSVDTFTDDGSVAGDCSVSPPDQGTTVGTNKLTVTVPATGQPAGATFFSIYASTDGSFLVPALLGTYPVSDYGVAKVFTDLTLLNGQPPAVSSCYPGANQIDPDTDILNWTWKLPVATVGALPTGGNTDGDARVVLSDYSVHIWNAGSSVWTALSGGTAGVSSFNTRVGAVVSVSGDYTAAQVNNAADKASSSQQAFTGEVRAPDFKPAGLTGATAAARFVGGTTSGAPATGTFALGDFIIDQSGKVWICTIAGTPGTWTQVSGGAGAVSSVFGRTGAVSAQPGDYTAAQVTNAADKSSSSQQAFTGEVEARDFAVAGLTGATAAGRYVGTTTSGAPASGTFSKGDWVTDQTGIRWTCTTAGSPGTWTQEPGSGGGGVAGVSSFNSRTGAVAPGNADYLAVASGLTGATAATRYVGGTSSGAPSTGTFSTGDFVIDQTGKIWICTAGGTSGTWTQVSGGGGGGGNTASSVVALGSTGSAQTVNLASTADQIVYVTGTLTANCTITISNRAAGCLVRLLLSQDGTGGRTLTISDGSTSQAVTINSGAGAPSEVDVNCPNSTDLYISSLSIAGPAGANGLGFGNVVSKTASYTVVSGDNGSVLAFNGTSLTATLPSAAPGEPWMVTVLNVNASALTLSPNGLNLNGSAASITLSQNQALFVWSDGTNYEYGTGPAGPTGASGSGGLLAVHTYALGTDTHTDTTSTSFVDVDATNQAITFTAPASGKVLVRVSGIFDTTNFTNNCYICLRNGATNIGSVAINAPNTTVQSVAAVPFYVTGLTSGNSYTLKLGFRTTNAGTTAQIWSGPNFGPVTYEAWSA